MYNSKNKNIRLLPNKFVEPIYQNLDQELAEKFEKLYHDNYEKFATSPGSLHNHQTWIGGYIDHILDMINIANHLWKMNNERTNKLPFSYQDLIFVILLHDIEKPFKYSNDPAYQNKSSKEIQKEIIEKYNFELTDIQKNALKYAHGENEDYVKNKRVMNELAAYLHACDVISARAHYDFKQE